MKFFDHNIERSQIYRAVITYVFLVIAAIGLQSVAHSGFFINELNYLSAPYRDALGIAKAVVYCVSYAIAVAIFLVLLLQRSKIIAILFGVLIGVAYTVDLSSKFIGSRNGFTEFQYALFLNEANNYHNLVIYRSDMFKGLLFGVLLVIALLGIRKVISVRLSKRWLLAVPVLVLPTLIAKAGVHYISFASYPAPIKIPIIAAEFHINYVEQPERVLDENIQAKESELKNIVLIVDESISGTHLSINGYERDTTPDLKEYTESGVITNYGVVNSTGNCSALSQLLLRIGLSPINAYAKGDFVSTRIALPTMYQYAKRAGYKTWLIDAQVKDGTITNYLTYNDKKFIDEYFTNDARTEDSKRDWIGLEKLRSVMTGAASKNFIVFVKDGAHWPYLWRYPKDQTIYSPIQTSEYDPMQPENKEKVVNTYDNVVKYTVNDFLKKYIESVDLTSTVTFYTSDHGQAFFEPTAKDNLTHCGTYYDPPSSQVRVPLLVIDKDLRHRYEVSSDKVYSQHQIFPSLLREMGYADDIVKQYGNTLHEGYPADHQRWFYWSMEGDRSPYLITGD